MVRKKEIQLCEWPEAFCGNLTLQRVFKDLFHYKDWVLLELCISQAPSSEEPQYFNRKKSVLRYKEFFKMYNTANEDTKQQKQKQKQQKTRESGKEKLQETAAIFGARGTERRGGNP